MGLISGTTLRQYEIVEPIGAGSMGEVYRAHDARLGRDVAIKVLPGHLAGDPEARARFDREARAVASLSHPNLLAIHEFTVADNVPFAVMELLEGETLRQRIAAGPLPWRRALEITQAAAEGLAAAHARGVIHRDLKPENIFLTSAGSVKILDFGLAAPARGTAVGSATTIVGSTPGVVAGTLGYIAPEQLQGLPPDARSDLFSLGCVLFEMLSGRRPFGAATAQEAIAATLRDPAPLLPPLQPPAPPELARIVDHCLARGPERRFASARDLVLAIQGVLHGSGPLAAVPARRRPARGKSIAVLPFENPGSEPATEYLADGLTESIINMLSQLPGVRVVPRTSVFRYKGVAVDPSTAAMALNARTLLSGRVLPRGDTISIQAELVDAATESQIWGEQYRRPLNDLLALQEEIAWHISEALRLKLTGAQKTRLRKRSTTSGRAYEEYLKGLFEFNKWTQDGFRRSLEHLERAVEIDPDYALAWSALGNAAGALSYFGRLPALEGFPRAEAAARRALELEPTLAQAHLTMGLVRLFFTWDTQQAEESFKRAMALNQGLPDAHAYYAFCLEAQGRAEEGLAEARLAKTLDPMGSVPNMAVGWALYQSGRFEECVEHARHAIGLDPALLEAHALISLAFERLGRFEQAARHLPGALQVFGVPLEEGTAAAAAIDASSAERYWASKLATLVPLDVEYPLLPTTFAIAHAALGDLDAAVAVLEPLVPQRAGFVVFLRNDPSLRPLRGFPRFEALLKSANVR